MQNFPQVSAEQLRKLRTTLAVHSPGDPVWEGAVGQLLQLLIDADLAHHRTTRTEEKKAEPVGKKPLAGYKYPEDEPPSIFHEPDPMLKQDAPPHEPAPKQAW